jgi:hypothetical protein
MAYVAPVGDNSSDLKGILFVLVLVCGAIYGLVPDPINLYGAAVCGIIGLVKFLPMSFKTPKAQFFFWGQFLYVSIPDRKGVLNGYYQSEEGIIAIDGNTVFLKGNGQLNIRGGPNQAYEQMKVFMDPSYIEALVSEANIVLKHYLSQAQKNPNAQVQQAVISEKDSGSINPMD